MTAQVHELLILNGEETSMAFCPPLPYGDPRLLQVVSGEAEPSEINEWIFSSACWRRYRGTWEIKDGRLYLVRLQGIYKLVGDDPIPADWFAGVLRVPRGKELVYVHMGFGTVFEQELHIKIENGVVTATRIIDNRGKKHDEWQLGMRNLPGFENRFPGDDEL